MDYKPQPLFKGDSYGYALALAKGKKKRCMWFNSAFMDDITFANGKIIDMTFNVPPFQIYNPNNLKVISYIRDDANTKPIVIKMKEPYLTNRSVINTDKEGFPLIYCNHTGVEGMTTMSPKFTLNPQQISRFVFKIDESLNNRDGLTVNETIIQSTTTLNIKSSMYSINYEPFKHIKSGTYTATFSGGNINFNGINDKSYTLLKDGSGITINPVVWYKFDGDINDMLLDSSGNNYNLWNSNATINTTTFIKGNASSSFNGSTQFLTNRSLYNINGISFSISLWCYPTKSSFGGFNILGSIGEMPSGSITDTNYIQIANFEGRWGIGNAFNPSATQVQDLNTWVHLVYTFNSVGATKEEKLYKNGSFYYSTSIMTSSWNLPNQVIEIGRRTLTDSRSFWLGLVDDFRIYNSLLTATQVSELYNGRLAIYNAPSFELGVELEDTNLTKDNIASIYSAVPPASNG